MTDQEDHIEEILRRMKTSTHSFLGPNLVWQKRIGKRKGTRYVHWL